MTGTTLTPVADRVDALDWATLRTQLDDRGFAVTAPLLDGDECTALADLFDGGRFRSTIEMARHRFGDGRYRYFDHPLPETVAALREAFYRRRPRAQSWAHVIEPQRGAFVVFPTQERPNEGKRGYHRVKLRHGVSTITEGSRTALGVIFHDAR